MKKLTLQFPLLTLLICSFLYSTTFAQDCDQVLKDGVFNQTTINSNSSLQTSFYEYIYSQDFSTHQEAIDAGISIGTVVYGVPLQIAGTFSKQQKDEWRSTHQQYKNSTLSKSDIYSALMRFASPDILDAWTTCIINNAPSRVGLYGWIQEVSSTSAILHLTWLPMAGDNGESPVVVGSSVSGGFRSDNANGSVLPVNYKFLQGANGNLVQLMRKPNEALVVVINTTRGDISCSLKAVSKPEIINFQTSKSTIDYGESAFLNWNVSKATQVLIDNGIGTVSSNGSLSVSPTIATQYKLAATNVSGTVNGFVTLHVNPLPPTLVSGNVDFNTTDDDKDDDTRVTVYIKSGGNTYAQWSGTEGHWDNNSHHGPYGLSMTSTIRKDQLIGAGQAVLIESPNGHDEWHFNWTVILNFSDGTSKRYDWGGNVDYDRTTLSNPIQ